MKSIDVYLFSELSEKAQAVALEYYKEKHEWYQDDIDFEFEYIRGQFEEVVEGCGFSLDNLSYSLNYSSSDYVRVKLSGRFDALGAKKVFDDFVYLREKGFYDDLLECENKQDYQDCFENIFKKMGYDVLGYVGSDDWAKYQAESRDDYFLESGVYVNVD